MATFNQKFDSIRQDWDTPQSLFDRLDMEFKFTTDLAASDKNTKCKNYFDEERNGLNQMWDGVCWLNPPYGDKKYKLIDWIKKARRETQSNPNLTVVMLIPSRTNTKWFHRHCMKAKEIRFICGRPKFGGAKHGLPQPLAFIVFGQSDEPTKFTSFYI